MAAAMRERIVVPTRALPSVARKIVKLADAEVRRVKHTQKDGHHVVTFEGWASTNVKDRYGDIVEPMGWDLLNYSLNPVLLWSHNSFMPIGGAPSIRVVPDRGLYVDYAEVVVNKYVEEQLLPLLDTGYLKGMSVGFLPRKWEALPPEKAEEEPDGDEDGLDEWLSYRFLEQELVEISLTPTPANPLSLFEMTKALEEGGDARVVFVVPTLSGSPLRGVTGELPELPPVEGPAVEGVSDSPVCVRKVSEFAPMRIATLDATEIPPPESPEGDPAGWATYVEAHLVAPRTSASEHQRSACQLPLCKQEPDGTSVVSRDLLRLTMGRVLSHRDGLGDENRTSALETLTGLYRQFGMRLPRNKSGQPLTTELPFSQIVLREGESEALIRWQFECNLRATHAGAVHLAKTDWQPSDGVRECIEQTGTVLTQILEHTVEEDEERAVEPDTPDADESDTPDADESDAADEPTEGTITEEEFNALLSAAGISPEAVTAELVEQVRSALNPAT